LDVGWASLEFDDDYHPPFAQLAMGSETKAQGGCHSLPASKSLKYPLDLEILGKCQSTGSLLASGWKEKTWLATLCAKWDYPKLEALVLGTQQSTEMCDTRHAYYLVIVNTSQQPASRAVYLGVRARPFYLLTRNNTTTTLTKNTLEHGQTGEERKGQSISNF
jgi:hypothetical protein